MSKPKNCCILKASGLILAVFLVLSLTGPAQAAKDPVSSPEGPVLAAPTGALVVDFKQSANKDSPYPQGDIHWIGSILQQNNSIYYEGMSTLQRIVFISIPKTTGHVHTLTLSHEATKGGIHAYDFLTSWPQGVQAGNEIGGPTMFVNVNECGESIGPPANLDEICAALHASGFTATPSVPDAMGSVGGHDVATRVAAYEAHLGDRTIKIYGNTAVSAASVAFDGYSGSTDNQYANYTLTWTSSSDSIVIELAGHLAAGTDPILQPGVGYGAGYGSASISGGPYHFKLSYLDGSSLGSQDNQIKGADILLPPPVCDVTPAADSICVGFDATFTDHSTGGTPPYSWVWTKPPDPTVLSTDSTLTISGATLADAGQYRVIVTDANSLSDTCYADLVVYPLPSCSIAPPSDEICFGDSAKFCVIPSGGTAPYTYQWNHGPTDSCIWLKTAGTYPVLVTDAKGCTTSCQASLTVNPLPSCSVSPSSDEICFGDSAKFCVIPSGGTAPYTYAWDHGPTDSCVWISAAGTYPVLVTDAKGCTTSCQASLTVNPLPSCSVNPSSDEICFGDSAKFCVIPSGGTAPYTYAWDHGPTDSCVWISSAGTYPVLVTDAKGCTTSCQASLTVNPLPSCSVNPSSDEICYGDSAKFCVIPSGGTAPYTYAWDHGPTDSCVWISSAGTYPVLVTDAKGCTTSCQASLTVNPLPSCSIDPDSTNICEGDSAKFCVIPSGGTAPYTYQWNHGPTDSCIWLKTAGTYPVLVTDAKGCTTSCQAKLTTEPCGFCTFTIGGWGSKCPDPQKDWPMSTQPGCIRDHFFSQVFPSGVWIGDPAIVPPPPGPKALTDKGLIGDPRAVSVKDLEGIPAVPLAQPLPTAWYAALWQTPAAVQAFLPDGGQPGVLDGDLINPVSTSAGVLGSQILALRMNVAFSCSGVFTYLGLLGPGSCYGEQTIPGKCGRGKFNGIMIDDFLAIADSAVGGELDAIELMNNYGAKLSDVNFTASCLNEQFSSGIDNSNCMVIPALPSVPISAAKVSASAALPTEFSLSYNYPNPFNPTCVIEYALPTDCKVTLSIYNVLGQKVRVLVDDYKTAGYKSVEWDGRDNQGQELATGVYFYRIKAGDFVQAKKMVLMK